MTRLVRAPEWKEMESWAKEGIYIDDETRSHILCTAERLSVDTSNYRKTEVKLEITHPRCSLNDKYQWKPKKDNFKNHA